MALVILTTSSAFQSVRNLVEMGSTDEDIPEAVIADDAIGGAAERYVLSRVAYDDLDADGQASAALAVYQLTAATLLGSMGQTTSEKHNDELTWTIARANVSQRIAALRESAQEIINSLITSLQPERVRFSHFRTAPAKRVRGF